MQQVVTLRTFSFTKLYNLDCLMTWEHTLPKQRIRPRMTCPSGVHVIHISTCAIISPHPLGIVPGRVFNRSSSAACMQHSNSSWRQRNIYSWHTEAKILRRQVPCTEQQRVAAQSKLTSRLTQPIHISTSTNTRPERPSARRRIIVSSSGIKLASLFGVVSFAPATAGLATL